MRRMCWHVSWWARFLGWRVLDTVLHGDFGHKLAALALEAACRGDSGRFTHALGAAGDLTEFDAGTIAVIALAAYTTGDQALAERLFEEALARGPENAEVMVCYGSYLQRNGNCKEGIAFLERGLKADPGDATALSWLGNAYYASGNLLRARECYEASIRLEGQGNGESYMGLAFVAGKEGKSDEELRLWREATARMPHDAMAWYNLGDALYLAGQWNRAIRAFRKSLDLKWEKPHYALYGIAVSYMEVGNVQDARRFCVRALEAKPDYELASQLLEEIEAEAK